MTKLELERRIAELEGIVELLDRRIRLLEGFRGYIWEPDESPEPAWTWDQGDSGSAIPPNHPLYEWVVGGETVYFRVECPDPQEVRVQ